MRVLPAFLSFMSVIVSKNINLQPFNTFGITATAAVFTRVTTVQELLELIHDGTWKRQPVLILGGGSNILFTQNPEGVVVKNEIKGIHIVKETADAIHLQAGAGEVWHDIVRHCVERDWGGIENLSLIPGTAGAAPMQNIGAYGVEIKDVLESVEAIDVYSGSTHVFQNADCQFGYRESIFKQEAKGKYMITSITLRLTKNNHRFVANYGAIHDTLKAFNHDTLSVKSISNAVIHIRKSKLPDPAVIGNAGSFFKNPSITQAKFDALKKSYPQIPGFPGESPETTKVPAAWLIEQCGWKGKRFDKIGVNPLQPLVLVNYGGGEGKKIWELALQIQTSVKEKFNIELTPEVNII